MLESVAKMKICPLTTVLSPHTGKECIGFMCMAWEQDSTWEDKEQETRGDCGLEKEEAMTILSFMCFLD